MEERATAVSDDLGRTEEEPPRALPTWKDAARGERGAPEGTKGGGRVRDLSAAEGMALYVGYSLLPRDGLAQHLRESEEKGAKLTPDLLDLTSQGICELPKEEQEKVVAAALGFVAEVGFERLLGLLREGALTREKLLALIEQGRVRAGGGVRSCRGFNEARKASLQ